MDRQAWLAAAVRGARCATNWCIATTQAVPANQPASEDVTRGPASMVLPALFHQLFCRVLGVQVEVRGKAVASPHAVFISNHLSHLDIPVIGSVLRACFVAKDDIRDWPLFGALARLQQTVFVSRNSRRVAEVASTLAAAPAAGHRLVLFPEGTTSDGIAVLPFKSSVFLVLADPMLRRVVVQPITIELLAVDGVNIADGGDRDRYACYGAMQLLPHLLAFIRGSGAHLRPTMHAPLPDSTGFRARQWPHWRMPAFRTWLPLLPTTGPLRRRCREASIASAALDAVAQGYHFWRPQPAEMFAELLTG